MPVGSLIEARIKSILSTKNTSNKLSKTKILSKTKPKNKTNRKAETKHKNKTNTKTNIEFNLETNTENIKTNKTNKKSLEEYNMCTLPTNENSLLKLTLEIKNKDIIPFFTNDFQHNFFNKSKELIEEYCRKKLNIIFETKQRLSYFTSMISNLEKNLEEEKSQLTEIISKIILKDLNQEKEQHKFKSIESEISKMIYDLIDVDNAKKFLNNIDVNMILLEYMLNNTSNIENMPFIRISRFNEVNDDIELTSISNIPSDQIENKRTRYSKRKLKSKSKRETDSKSDSIDVIY